MTLRERETGACGQTSGIYRRAETRSRCCEVGDGRRFATDRRLSIVDYHHLRRPVTAVSRTHVAGIPQRIMNDKQQSQPSIAVEYTEFTLGTKTISLISDPDNPRAWLKSDVTTTIER